MTKTLAILGGTGTQGGSVATIMSTVPGWKLRIITRNPTSSAAQTLASAGHEIVQADANDEASLITAFSGANAIFALTDFWTHFYTTHSASSAGKAEKKQGINIAVAAAKTASLEHFIWSTLPHASKLTNGKTPVPHFDFKGQVDEYIKTELPELAKITTFFIVGFYPVNLGELGMVRPFEVRDSGKHVLMLPTNPNALIPLAGDVSVNVGLWVRGVLSAGAKTFTRYVAVITETTTFVGMLEMWSQATGRDAVFVKCSDEEYKAIWGPLGKEMVDQMRFGEEVPGWLEGYDVLGMEELGLKMGGGGEVVGSKEAFERVKDRL